MAQLCRFWAPWPGQHSVGFSSVSHDEVGDLLRPVDLDVVPGTVEQVQFGVREQGGELPGDPGLR
jgi:hypothetical protein